ncbi:hypothetical protein AKJ09_00577 [Labilithrix luteola]|uniref:Uncharacterized protein n=1 Tax=Labilithrix luteola TaxID=1391654 RepID=A0A0K1PK45_9BACT|nr:hypothetical protein [Labilithrix luteola]AKU93913.1 hypothetical protein AKJ09_00577 [Labilithrix luteola]
MTLYSVKLPLPWLAHDYIASLWNDVPKDTRRERLVRLRGNKILAKFYKSKEYRAITPGPGYASVFVYLAYAHHAVTVDELTPEVVRDVAARFVSADDSSTVTYWVDVIYDELMAFFRMLERRGERFAPACIEVLEKELLPKYEAMYQEICEAATTPLPETALLSYTGAFRRGPFTA